MLFKVIAFIVILALIILNIIYRMQIKNIYKEVHFINEYETNKIITQNIKFKDITILVDELNKLVHDHRSMAKEYKAKDEALKEAITNISHDIRTPLTSLNGYFQLLIESESKEEKERYINIIQIRINSLKNLLEDMFTYIKIKDSNYELKKEDCNLKKLVENNLFSYYEDFNFKGIEPNINLHEERIIIESNPIALDRIISNLVNNSLIHGKDYIGIRLFKEDDIVSLIIENDVENIENIDLDNIFNRFYKNDKARTVNSTGLGLTIVKELVEAIEGEIEANIRGNIFSIKISLKN